MAAVEDTGLRATGPLPMALTCGLLGVGLVLANPPILYLAAAFALVFLAESVSVAVVRVSAESTVPVTSVCRGDRFFIDTSIDLGVGLGTAYVHFEMPRGAVIQGGSNLRAIPLMPWPRRVNSRVEAVAGARGEFLIPQPSVKVVSLWGQFSRMAVSSAAPTSIAVRPRHHLIKRFRELRALGKTPLPDNSIAFTGVRSDSFKELREYRPGDRASRVNWRASAKVLSSDMPRLPLVNEYEVEGKKVVWLFVDGSMRSAVGTSEENAFEYFLDATLSVASFFISRGYKVGASIFSSGVLIRSDSGAGQIAKVMREFIRAEAAPYPERLTFAVESARPFLSADRPLCFLMTRPEVDRKGVGESVKRLRTIVGRRAKVFVVAVRWSAFHPPVTGQDRFAAKAMDALVLDSLRSVQGAGATPVLWDPRAQRFGELMTRVAAASVTGMS